LNRPIWRQPAFIILVLLNLAAAVGVALDLERRLGAPPPTLAPARAGLPPTLVPAPTPAVEPRPASPTPTPAPPTPTATPLPPANLPHTLIADDRFTYAPDFYTAEVQAFLEEQGSILARATVPLGDGEDSFAHALVGQCIRYSLNPKVLLALLEVQSGLIRGTGGGPEAQTFASRQDFAFGYRQAEWQGLDRQLQWAAYTLAVSFRREELPFPRLTDGKQAAVPAEAGAATRALLRLLAYTADSQRYAQLRSSGPGSFVATYRELFGEDPRLPLSSPPPAQEPFLWPPYTGSPAIVSYFDHEYPTFEENGTILTYGGERGHASYDGHDGWDYALPAGSPVLAAAAGRVVFAGFLDTGCATPAGLVVLDHGQGYRTLYWHLQSIEVAEGQELRRGARLGTVGSTGCSSGPHLHLGVEFLGRDVDPYGWCGSPAMPEDPWAAHPAGAPSRWLWANRPSPCPIPAGAIVVDEEGAGFEKSPALWREAQVGYGGHALWTVSAAEAAQSIHRGVWRPDLPAAGRYFLYAHIPWYDTGRPDTAQARYHIRHANGETTLTLSQADWAGLWLPLGEYYFAQGARGYVYLDEATGEEGTTVWFDALVWVRP
jgi:murein DD-endopeptidase MepM/ murein hydrolase activator NlpD